MKSLNILASAVIIVIAQACGSKPEKNNEEYASTETPAVKASTTTRLTFAEREAKYKKDRDERAEKRRIAFEERTKNKLTYTDTEGNVVYNKAEVNPSFTGGEMAMEKYFNDNIQYPADAKEKEVEGTVFVDFVVAPDGSVREVGVTDAPGEEIDPSLRAEAIRVVQAMPKWVPGRQRGKAVHVNYSLPVTFLLR